MRTRTLTARVGSWYQDLQTGILFEVVAVDESSHTIEAQLRDGALCEYDLDSWSQMTLRTIEESEDWRDPFEQSDEDAIDPDLPWRPDDANPLDHIEPDAVNGLDDNG